MPEGKLFGVPRPGAQASLGVQVATRDSNNFDKSDVTRLIRVLDDRLQVARADGNSLAVMTVENGKLIGKGGAIKFKVSPITMNEEQIEASFNVIKEVLENSEGTRLSSITITIY